MTRPLLRRLLQQDSTVARRRVRARDPGARWCFQGGKAGWGAVGGAARVIE